MAHLLSQQYTFGGTVVPGYYPASVGNPNLGWESTKQTRLRRRPRAVRRAGEPHRRHLSARRRTTCSSPSTCRSRAASRTALQNAGSVSNNGVRARPHAHDARRQEQHSLGWTTTFNYSHNKNKVLDLGGVQQIFASSVNSDLKLLGTLIQVGQPLGVFYGYKTDGLLRDSATAAAYTAAVKPLVRHEVECLAT